MMKSYVFFLFGILCNLQLWAQHNSSVITGKVVDSEQKPLIGANVYWQKAADGTTTDAQGNFKISCPKTADYLIASYIGFSTDTLFVKANSQNLVATFVLKAGTEIEQVVVHSNRGTTFSSSLEPMKMQVMTEHELTKAACCNLSESFETNPSVDVSFTDAVTGTKQIQMLGLAGPYIQISKENMPDIRGLSAVYGLTFIPGPWVESIHLNKGAGSVVNGFESITGQIDVQLRTPNKMDTLYVNLFANQSNRYELNINTKKKINDHLSTALLLHGKTSLMSYDGNNDGFVDMPMGNQYIALNRWEYESGSGMHAQFGVKGTYFDNTAGQMDFEKHMNRDTLNPWGMNVNIQRVDAFSKIGKTLKKPGHSFGLQASGVHHVVESFYGLHNYNATQNSGYANFIFQGLINNSNHIYKAGASFQYDQYDEQFDATPYHRIESIPGIFGEYTYSYLSKFNVVAGLRADVHNEFGAFVTPRLHLRYAPTTNWILRASGGRGQRTANIFAENSNLLSSSREIIVQGNGSSSAYGLLPEVAWNYGGNITRNFKLMYRKGSVSVDAYRTQFENQIVVDFVQDPQKAIFYNLDGQSFSNSVQMQIDYELIKRMDMRIAYRWYDVQTTYNGILQKKPLLAEHRAFINLGYKTRNNWKFDYTINWQGKKPLPNLDSNPVQYQIAQNSTGFILMNAQVSKSWNETFELYLGVENLTNFIQKNPIIASAEPYSKYFDSSLIWGPVYGREIYVGLRYRIN